MGSGAMMSEFWISLDIGRSTNETDTRNYSSISKAIEQIMMACLSQDYMDTLDPALLSNSYPLLRL
jgi:hypothetical protein